MKKLIIIYVVLIIAVVLLAMFGVRGNLARSIPFIGGSQPEAKIGDRLIKLELAKSPQEKSKGLSNRDSLEKDRGMLFLFDQKDILRFWMKETRFPLDIIYLDENKVVHVVENAPSSAQAPNLVIYEPDEPANKVLELNAGQAKELGIKDGTVIEFTNVK